MTVSEVWHRGNNLVAVAIIALAGFAFLPETFIETERQFKVDDGLLFVLGLVAIGWYLKGKNRFTRSAWPMVIVWAGLLVKVVGLVLEFKDKEDVGDDFGGTILFILASFFVTWLYIKGKKLLEK